MFKDRRDAGVKLAEKLHDTDATVVVGMPRGGVVVAAEVARVLELPLAALLVRKLGAPRQPELGIGAIADGGVEVLNDQVVRLLGMSSSALDIERTRQMREMERQRGIYGLDEIHVAGESVLLVDDGLATGVTARAAARSLHAHAAAQVVLAVPVGAPDSVAELVLEVDQVVCLLQPVGFGAVGRWYKDFRQTTDTEVLDCLRSAAGPSFRRSPRSF